MNKGFTLIELLAVIVILAIIALIASPIIIGLIDDARKESFKNSAYGIAKAGEILYSKDLLNGINEEVIFTYSDGVEVSSVSGKKLDYNGTNPKTGSVVINSEGKIAIAIHNGTYCTQKGYQESEIILSDKTESECIIPFSCGADLVDSRDNNFYKTVQIGEQCWMAENLEYTENGCLIKAWDDSEPHDACRTHQAGDGTALGEYNSWTGTQVLYQWGTAMNGSTTEGGQGICPDGWHIPTDDEWITLRSYLGTTPGTKIKSSTFWDGTDNYKFNALPVGKRSSFATLEGVGGHGVWWSSSISGAYILQNNVSSSAPEFFGGGDSPYRGISVRCLLDN